MSNRIVLVKLKKFREEIGLTQEDLARLIDVTVRTIQRIESGGATSLSTAKSIASVLELSSYKEMLNEEVIKEKISRSRFSKTKEGINDALVGRLKERNVQQILILFFTIVSIFYIAGRDPSILVLPVVSVLPMATILTLMSENKIAREDKIPSFSFFIYLLGVLIFTNVFLGVFIVFSMLGIFGLNGSNYIEVLHMSPGIVTFGEFIADHGNFIRSASAVALIVCFLLIHYLIYKERKKGVSFLYFASVYGCVFIYSLVTSLLFSKELLPSFNPLVYEFVVFSVFIIGLVLGGLKYATTRDARVTYLMGAVSVFLPSLIALCLFLPGISYIEKEATLNFDYAKKSIYCKSNINKGICWDVRLLEKHGIEVNEDNLTVLSAKNGNAFAMVRVTSKFQIPKEIAINNKPLPIEISGFLAKSQKRALRYRDKKGVVRDYLLGANRPQSDSLKVFELLLDEREYLQWIDLAISDKDEFVKSFKTAPNWLIQHIYLKELYIAMSGKWKVNSYKNEVIYGGGRLSVILKNGEVKGKTLVDPDLIRIALIPDSELPEI